MMGVFLEVCRASRGNHKNYFSSHPYSWRRLSLSRRKVSHCSRTVALRVQPLVTDDAVVTPAYRKSII